MCALLDVQVALCLAHHLNVNGRNYGALQFIGTFWRICIQIHALCSQLYCGLSLNLHSFYLSCLNSQVCKYCHLPAKECSVRDCCMWTPTLPTTYSSVQQSQQAEQTQFPIPFAFYRHARELAATAQGKANVGK